MEERGKERETSMQIYSCKSLIEPLTGTDTVSLPFSLYQTGSQSWWPVGRLFFSSLCLSFCHCGHFSMANTEDKAIRVLCLLCVGQCSVRQIGKMQWRCCWVIILLWLCYIYKTTVEKMCWERKRKRERERREKMHLMNEGTTVLKLCCCCWSLT